LGGKAGKLHRNVCAAINATDRHIPFQERIVNGLTAFGAAKGFGNEQDNHRSQTAPLEIVYCGDQLGVNGRRHQDHAAALRQLTGLRGNQPAMDNKPSAR
jgi:hypothetical protein